MPMPTMTFRAALLAGLMLLPFGAEAQNRPRNTVLAQATPAPVAGTGSAPLPIRSPVVTLPVAEQMLLERNLAIIAARRGVDAARAQRLVANQLPPPTISVGNTTGQFNETNRQSFQGARFLSPSNNINAGITVIVERGGKRTLRTRLADENITVAEAQVLDTVRGQLFALRQGFVQALQARANLEVALANRASLDRTEALLRRQLRDGAIPEGDLLRFQASRVQFEADVTTNAQAYAAAVAAVAALLGTDAAQFQPGAGQAEALGLNPAAVPQPAAPAPARGRGTSANPAAAPTTVQTILSPVAFDVRGALNPGYDLGLTRDELAGAVPNRPDVLVAQRQASAALANRELAEAARSRDVTVGAGWSRTRLPQNLPPASSNAPNEFPTANNQFTLQLSVPIFTRGITEGNIGVAAAQQGQAEALSRATLLQARADFAAAWAGYEQARALANLYNSGAVQRAEEAYRSTEQAYLAGGRSLLDVLDALRTLNATRTAANTARAAYLLALATLEQASGVSGVLPKL